MAEFKLNVTVPELAAVLELSTRQVERLLADETICREENGDIYLPKAVRNYFAKKFDNADHIDFNEAKARHEYIKCKLSELELARRRNEVHDAEDVELLMGDMLSNIRTQFLGLPGKVAPQLVGLTREEIADILSDEVRTTLLELSDYNPTMFDVKPDTEDETDSD